MSAREQLVGWEQSPTLQERLNKHRRERSLDREQQNALAIQMARVVAWEASWRRDYKTVTPSGQPGRAYAKLCDGLIAQMERADEQKAFRDAEAEHDRLLSEAAEKAKPGELIWVEYPARGWVAYAVTRYSVGFVRKTTGEWRFHGEKELHGQESSIEAGKRRVEEAWKRARTAVREVKPMTDAQIVAQYKRGLINRIKRASPEYPHDAVSALRTMHRCGWLEDAPIVDLGVLGYAGDPFLEVLQEYGKLPDDGDVLKRPRGSA